MLFYRTKNEKICRRIWIFVIHKKSIQRVWGKNIGYCYENKTRSCKNCFQKVVQKAAATGELVGHRIAEKIVKPKPLSDVNSRNVEQEQRQVFL